MTYKIDNAATLNNTFMTLTKRRQQSLPWVLSLCAILVVVAYLILTIPVPPEVFATMGNYP